MNIATTLSAYVILVNDDNSMSISKKQRIVQKSKLVDDLYFLVKPEYNGHMMDDFTAVLEYLSPVSRKYRTEFLVKSEDSYNGYIKYMLPFDTKLTAEAGDVELMLSFVRTELDEKGMDVQRVRKITGTKINIVPISAWSDIIPDCALSALDQRIIKIDAQIRALNEANEFINSSKADNLSYNKDRNELQLLSGTDPIGDKIVLAHTSNEDGIPPVDFDNVVGGDNDDDNDMDIGDGDESDDVIEF